MDKEGRGYVYLYNGNDEYKNKRGKEGENELPPKPISSFEKIVKILLEKFNGNYRDVCILARNNKDLNEMEEYLSENRIPYFLETNQSVFDHRTIKPVIKLLRYLITDNIFYLLEFLIDDLYCFLWATLIGGKCVTEDTRKFMRMSSQLEVRSTSARSEGGR